MHNYPFFQNIRLQYLLIFLLVSSSIYGQTILTGKITDSAGRPVPYASVILMQHTVFVAGTSSDEKGVFTLTPVFKKGDTCSIRITCAGYVAFIRQFIYPDTSFMDAIMLPTDRSALKSVTVTARTPLVTRKSDRYIVNVENSYLANGNDGLEVLQKSPGVWVDNNGNIRIRGNQSVRVMINDVVQRMPAEELAAYLRTFKSEDISRIEIIQNPPAEFEAAGTGGIIHIILKWARKDGLNGFVNAQYRYQGEKPYINSGTSLNYKRKKLSFSAGYTFTSDRRLMKERAEFYAAGNSGSNNHTARREAYTSHQYRVATTIDLSARQAVSMQTIQTHSGFRNTYHSSLAYFKGSQITGGEHITGKRRLFQYGSTTLNYSLKTDTIGSWLKIIADYTHNNKAEYNHFSEQYDDPQQNAIYRNSMPFVTRSYSAQADYVKVAGKTIILKSGIKYVHMERDNTLNSEKYMGNNWVVDATQTNRFIYTESLLMAYVAAEKSWKHTSIQAGLRAEETFSKGNSVTLNSLFSRNYFGLFPSLFITQTLHAQKGNSIYVNYARRLSRPALRDVNPFRYQFNSYTSITGNPALLPQYAHTAGAGLRLKHDHSADIFYTYTKNVINLSAYSDSNHSIHYISENVNSTNEFGCNLATLFTLVKGWNTNTNLTLVHSTYRFYGAPVRQTSFSARTIHTIALKNNIDIDATVSYRSPYQYSNIYNPSTFYVDMGFAKKIMKHGRLRLYVGDVFNTLREKEITHTENTTILFYRKRQTRYVSLSFTWNFSAGKKFTTHKIEQGNAEERSRIGS
jgi:iron complex outermembrane receptor protein